MAANSLIRAAACVCSRRSRQLKAVRAVVAGVGRGVGRACPLLQVTVGAMQSSSALLLFAPARVAQTRWRGLWQTPWPLYGGYKLLVCWGSQLQMRTDVCDVIVSNVACYCEEKLDGGDKDLCARRLSLRRALKHAECDGVVGVGEK